MADNKKYYWIKLKTDYFNSDEIDFLLSQKNGCEYVVLYLMLCLKTANTKGMLSSNIGEMIVPYDVEKIVRDTKHFDTDTVIVALELYKKLGLVYEDKNGCLAITNYENMVGSETSSAKAMREWRKKKIDEKALQCISQCDNNVTQEYRDKSIEYRVKSIEKDIYTAPSDLENHSMPIIELTLNDKSLYPICQEQIDEWKELYPSVDILQELKKMKGWLNANPSKRKTKRGILRFINGWLSREQDKGYKADTKKESQSFNITKFDV